MRRITVAMLTVCLGIGALAGCGGGSDEGSKGSSGASAASGADGGDTGGDTADNPLADLASKASDARIKVTYRTDEGDEITIARDGTDRVSFTTDGNTLYSVDGKTISCDGTGPDAECTELPLGNLGGGLLTAFTAIFEGLTKLDSDIYGGTLTDETIAGRSARCATFTASDFAPLGGLGGGDFDPTAEAVICVDAETGILLRLGASSAESSKELLEATAVAEPTDADFEPPTTPQTLPDLPGGITIPSIPQIPGEG